MTTSVVDALVAALDAHDVDAVLGTFAPDGEVALPQLHRTWTGSGVAEGLRALLVAFPDLSWHAARRYVGAGSREFEEGVWVGTHEGPLGGHAATGRNVNIRGRVIYESGDSLLQRVEIYTDLTALYRQLGLPAAGLPVSAAEFMTVDVPDDVVVHVRAPEDEAAPRSRQRRALWTVAALTAAVLAGAVAFEVVHALGTKNDAAAVAPSGSPSPAVSTVLSPVSPSPSSTPARTPEVTTQGNRVIVSADVLFATGSATLTAGAQQVISQVVAILQHRHVHGEVKVYGYTDNVGPASFNDTLSQARANSVVAALKRAAPTLPVQYAATGFGERDPVASNATAAGRAKNRRVTILLPSAR